MRNGLLAAEKDSESLAVAIELLLDDPALRQRLGANGRRTVMETLSLDRATAKVRDLLLRAGETDHSGPERVDSRASRGLETVSQEVIG